jgi:transketolase
MVTATMREQLADTATDLLGRDPRVAIVLAEISTDSFRAARHAEPGRVVNVGIMEQTMVGVAAGFAMEGFHPIVHTIAPFLTERPFEQVKLDFGYQGLGGTFASVGASYDYASAGGTHHAPGDVQVMLSIPGMEVFIPGHPQELDGLLRATYANDRPTYLRASVAQNDEPVDVVPGRIEVVRRGKRATILAIGPMLSRALAATRGLDVSILYATSLAPFDGPTLAEEAGDQPFVIAVEPFYEGTTTPAIVRALGRVPARIASIGVPRRFLREYGTPEENDRALGLDAAGIRRRIAEALAG